MLSILLPHQYLFICSCIICIYIAVMRLTKPSLMPFHPLICDKRDLSGGIYQQMDSDDLSKPSGVDYFGVGDLLTLPQNFG